MKKVKEYFDHYKGHDECFQTSDGFIFHTDFDAKAHAGTLKDRKVERFEREAKVVKDQKSEKEPGVNKTAKSNRKKK